MMFPTWIQLGIGTLKYNTPTIRIWCKRCGWFKDEIVDVRINTVTLVVNNHLSLSPECQA